uniref:Uncharacterized protein n=1 Tax=Tanacetum cinerariifolium TaxID=118510 RepID=A0A699VSC1_TANCI|nr:hypothetical protein [Tanacetum cinerariifolium]
MLEEREEKERLKKKLNVVQEEKEQVEQDLRQILPSVDEERPINANGDVTTLHDAHPSEPRGSPRDS